MKVLGQGITLALVAAGLAAVPALAAQAATSSAAPAPKPTVVQKMKDGARGSVATSRDAATGKVDFVRAGLNGDLMPAASGSTRTAAAAKADKYLTEFGSAFGAARGELQRESIQANDLGWTVNYTQSYEGVPVFGSLLRAHVDQDGSLTSVNGYAAPDIALETEAARSPQSAAARAIAFVKSSPSDAASGSTAKARALKATSNDLVVYRTGAIKGDDGENVLAYVVEVSDGAAVREKVFVDANTGKVLNRYSMVDNALDRELREAFVQNGAVAFETVWEEGDPFPGGLNQDQQNLVTSSGESYWFFKNAFNRDSYDGDGAKRITVNNDPRISCPNANWNGLTTNYCDGVTSDDVVAHEWGHAYTEYTWGGIYQWQPGALNEAYSDIWGETLDLINRREDEGEGDINAKRPVGLCSSHSPTLPLLTINSPAPIAKDCLTGGAAFGEQLDETGITGDVAIAADPIEPPLPGTTTPGTTTDGCSDYTNEADVVGKIVMVDRGFCTFEEKAIKATEMGAAALIIGNRDESVISMSGTNPDVVATVSIGLTDRESIRTAITGGSTVNVTMKDAGGVRHDSFRWLIGEKSEAFGGAIRDMWNPTCYGDPGKVTDVEYKCSTDDQGGVHGNSGVPNHGYALLVDGGTYNGQTVEGIGLTKAAAIYYKAMNEYMTPVSDFTDHADALESSCVDLTGKQLRKLSVEPNDSGAYDKKITSADCAQVAAMALAVELRTEPVQCDFGPQLDPNTPALCGDGTESETVFSDDFEEGIADWTLDGESVFGGETMDWETSTDLPEGNAPVGSETAAFGPAPDNGTCTGDEADFSSVNTMTSDDIVVGEEGGFSPRLSFDHNIQTELGFDGGNLQVSVNGGDFEPVPAEAYTFNGPTVLATEDAGNTNPLAGQPGFTGTDGGEIVSDWGTSQVDLEAMGVQAGDTIQLQFAIGRDGCGGVQGWWVDNVQVVLCEAVTDLAITATHEPEPSTYGVASDLEVTVDGPDGEAAPTGDVTASIQGTEVGDATLAGDPAAATIELPANLPAGSYQVFVRYEGDGTYDALTRSFPITVGAAATTVTAVRTPASTQYRQPSRLAVTVTPPVGLDEAPTGAVEVTDADDDVIATGVLDEDGEATVNLPAALPAGGNPLTVTYVGEGNFAEGSTNVSAPVTKATTRTTATGRPNPVKLNATITARVVVDQDFGTSTGVVEIWFSGDRVGRGTLSNGVVNIQITKNIAVGRRTFTARFLGTDNIKPSSDQFTVRIVNAKKPVRH